jgi:hypothetical protein
MKQKDLKEWNFPQVSVQLIMVWSGERILTAPGRRLLIKMYRFKIQAMCSVDKKIVRIEKIWRLHLEKMCLKGKERRLEY